MRDHPALAQACEDADRVVPLFVFDEVSADAVYLSADVSRYARQRHEQLDAALDIEVRGFPGVMSCRPARC